MPRKPQKTRRIGGHAFRLTVGNRYQAGRSFARRGQTRYPVSVYDITRGPSSVAVATIEGLAYDDANRLLAEFNNGSTSFEGRVW
jgi:hypothetical protein